MTRRAPARIRQLLAGATAARPTIRQIRIDASTVQSQLAIELPPELAQRALAALQIPDDRIAPGAIHVTPAPRGPRARKRPARKA